MVVEITSTWPEPTLLASIRRSLSHADEALLCVAFTNQKGVHLLAPELKTLGTQCRVLVTNVFADPSPALRQLSDWGNRVRVLNPSAGTYHAKIYLATHGERSWAVIGSANLTSGLLANIEAGVVLTGLRHEAPLTEAWSLGEKYWAHPAAVDWKPGAPMPLTDAMAPALRTAIEAAIPPSSTIATITLGKPNVIEQVTPDGVLVRTERSGARPELVDGWMLELGCEVLLADGRLTNRHLLDDLHVHRSSAVCAILAQLPEVRIASTRPIELRLDRRPSWADAFHIELAAKEH